MNHHRRVIASATVGLVLIVLARTVTALSTDVDGGWFMYAPDGSVPFSSSEGDTWMSALIWLAAIAIWAAVSWRLFGPRREEA